MNYRLIHNVKENKTEKSIVTEAQIFKMAKNYGSETKDIKEAIRWLETQTGFFKFEECEDNQDE